MKRIILLVLAFPLLTSCSKKSDNPTPSVTPTVQKPAATTPPVTPYYPLMMNSIPNASTEMTVSYGNNAAVERFVGHDDAHVPKADKYKLIVLMSNPTSEDTIPYLVWWVDGVPHSDVLFFKAATNAPIPPIPWLQTVALEPAPIATYYDPY